MIPHTPYYGTADATPLYLVAHHAAREATGDRALIERHLPNAEACLASILSTDEVAPASNVARFRRTSKASFDDHTLGREPTPRSQLRAICVAATLTTAKRHVSSSPESRHSLPSEYLSRRARSRLVRRSMNSAKRKTANAAVLPKPVRCFDQAAIATASFRFLRQPNRPITTSPVPNNGIAVGSGVAASVAEKESGEH
jgi:hypothetical protein